MITIRRTPEDRLLELGGGAHPQVHPECMGGKDVTLDSRMCQNEQGQQVTDIQWDLNSTPLPLGDAEFDGVLSVFAFEHISWRCFKPLLADCHRVLKPGGRITLVLPNTEEQVRWMQQNPEGWDGKDFFESASCILYGDQDYPENSHRCWLSPLIITDLLRNAGYNDVTVSAYGERRTDMIVQAVKSVNGGESSIPTIWGDVKEICGAKHPSGATCVLEKGHAGNHRSE